MNVQEIMENNLRDVVQKHLRDNGFGGLWCPDEPCGCQIDDLWPCNEDGKYDCEPGYKVPCPGLPDCPHDADCDWHISGEKPKGGK